MICRRSPFGICLWLCTTSLIDVEYNFFVASIDFKTNHAIFYLYIYIFEFGFVFDGHYILQRRYYSQLYSFFQFWFNGNSIWKNVSNSSSELAVLIRTEGIFSNNCWNTPLFKSGNDEVWSFWEDPKTGLPISSS